MPPMIPYEDLKGVNAPFEVALRASFGQTLGSGWYILGGQVQAFEGAFAAFCGARYCVGVASGLDALTLGLRALELPSGGEVIIPSNSYVASIVAVIQAGLIPVMVEPDSRTYNMTAASLAQGITSRTVAIMPVHLYGKPCPMIEIMKIASQAGLKVIEDCAQAHGAHIEGQRVGTFGHIGAYSFYPTKNLGALGDAGAIILNDAALFDKLKALRNYGSEKKYHNLYVGYNSRLDEIQAGFLNVKLPFLDKITAHKRAIAARYDAGLDLRVVKPQISEGDVFHIYPIMVERRDDLRAYLLDNGVGTEVHYPVPPQKQVAFLSLFSGQEYPVAAYLASHELSLPISYAHSFDQIDRVIALVNKFLGV